MAGSCLVGGGGGGPVGGGCLIGSVFCEGPSRELLLTRGGNIGREMASIAEAGSGMLSRML